MPGHLRSSLPCQLHKPGVAFRCHKTAAVSLGSPNWTRRRLHTAHASTKSKAIVEDASLDGGLEDGSAVNGDRIDVALGDLMPPGVTEETKHRVARYSGHKLAKRKIKEVQGGRPLSEYMALPVSQYSVLDAARIERIDDDTFKCFIGSFKMFGMTVEPIVTVSVVTNQTGCKIKMLNCELDGSDAVRAVNGVFVTRMTNEVSWEQVGDSKKLSSDATIEVAGLTPRYMNLVPIRFIEAVGNTIMQQILNISVPQFLKQLDQDYQNWAEGDDSRNAVSTGDWEELNDDIVNEKGEE